MPSIEILASSIFSQSFIVFVVAGILFTMFIRVRDIHLFYWAVSWVSYSLYLAVGGLGFLSKIGGWALNDYIYLLTAISLFFGYNSVYFFYVGTRSLLYKLSTPITQSLIFQIFLISCLTVLSLILITFDNESIFYASTFALRSLITGIIFGYLSWKIFILKGKHISPKIFACCLMIYSCLIQFYTLQGIGGLVGFDLHPAILGSLGIVDFTIQTVVVFSLVSWVLQKEHQQVLNTQKRLQDLAWEDNLTGLPNRLWLNEKSMPVLKSLEHKNHCAALLFIDLDGFKLVNDTYGHAIGDELLIQVANILKESLNDRDMACRLGGDEFLLLIVGENDRDKVIDTANNIRAQLEAIDIMSGHKIDISCSQGIAWFPDHAVDLETLIQLSDHAMYQAKKQGKAQLVEVTSKQMYSL